MGDIQGGGVSGDGYIERREEIMAVMKKTASFTEELLQENERLRQRVSTLEAQKSMPVAADNSFVQELMERLKQTENDKQELFSRFQEVSEENRNFAERYVEIEAENNNLANLYVASYQLHSTLDFDEVIQIITEIVINLIGAEAFAIALIDPKTEVVKAVSAEGIRQEEFPTVKLGEGVIGKVLADGEPFIPDALDPEAKIDLTKPIVAVPLKIKDLVFGVLCIYRFFEQKKELVDVDRELFTLLAGHAATAIFSSRLYTDSNRKLQTIQGLIQLMAS